jgi:hypothetical protein
VMHRGVLQEVLYSSRFPLVGVRLRELFSTFSRCSLEGMNPPKVSSNYA